MKKVLVILLVLLAIGGYFGFTYYQAIYGANTVFSSESRLLIVPENCELPQLLDSLSHGILTDASAFEKTAALKSFQKAKPGRYRIKAGMSSNDIINMLRGGWQEPVRVTFNNARSPQELSGKISSYLNIDSLTLLEAVNDPKYYGKYGFDRETFRTMFLPNTYEMYWTTSIDGLMDRMAKEYKSFWNDDRKKRASKIGMTQSEVTILASIVKAETAKKDEAKRVAGVYVNRLKKGIALQADPTLIYSLGDFSITRVLNKHKEIDSPYNTYMYAGLPPGPINYPSHHYIDAVLDAEHHDYLYFCAKEDFSGYHNFAKSYNQHLVNARNYQRALNNQGIYR